MLALRCPSCSAPLGAKPGQRIFVCGDCRTTSSTQRVSEGPLLVLTRRLVLPTEPWFAGESLHLLPVWSLRREGRLPLRIPAVGFDRMPLVLGLAQRLSRIDREIVDWTEAEHLPRASADLHAEEALELGRVLVLASDESAEEVEFGGLRLEDWPCVRRSSQLVELVSGRAASGRLLDLLEVVAKGPALLPAAP